MDKWLSRPTVLKLVALAIGIIMFAVVHFDPASTPNNVASLYENRVIDGVKIQPYGLDERNYVLLGLDPQKVKLTVRGTKSDLYAASTDDYKIQADMRTVGEGTMTLNLQFDLPKGIQLVQITPSTVTVTVEALETKEFEVSITTIGEPEQGYKAGTPVIKPSNRVHVTLPKNTLAKVERVGASIPIKGETETIKSKSVKLAAYDSEGNIIEGAIIDPTVVEVEVPITNPFKQVPLQFKLQGAMPAGLSIATFKPDIELVTVYGPQEALDKIDFVEADVQLAELTQSGKVTVPLKLDPPITQISPNETVISIEVVLSATRSLEGLPIKLNGLGEGLIATITDPSTGKADISVKGAPSVLDRLQPGDVQVKAELTGKGPGTHTVDLTVYLPRFIEQAGGTKTITVEIAGDVPATAPGEPDVTTGGEAAGEDGEGTSSPSPSPSSSPQSSDSPGV
ncbi:YbbR-like domain-containing protein [Cohnella faecalis]|uniref:CdaR family protein n=1 Tax=Cohnella faecalis TaxID=2315694 RepID=UPI0011C23715|nr:CdaR family protein [Cohnella faecalis]